MRAFSPGTSCGSGGRPREARTDFTSRLRVGAVGAHGRPAQRAEQLVNLSATAPGRLLQTPQSVAGAELEQEEQQSCKLCQVPPPPPHLWPQASTGAVEPSRDLNTTHQCAHQAGLKKGRGTVALSKGSSADARAALCAAGSAVADFMEDIFCGCWPVCHNFEQAAEPGFCAVFPPRPGAAGLPRGGAGEPAWYSRSRCHGYLSHSYSTRTRSCRSITGIVRSAAALSSAEIYPHRHSLLL